MGKLPLNAVMPGKCAVETHTTFKGVDFILLRNIIASLIRFPEVKLARKDSSYICSIV